MNKFNIIRCTLLCIAFASAVFSARAQGIDDLGVVWNKTYGPGTIRNIKPNPNDAGYVACGEPWNNSTPTGQQRLYGMVIEFDESGNELRRATAQIPQSYITAHTVDHAVAYFNIAFKTDDGGYLAFGTLQNVDAPLNEKEYDWSTSTYASSPHLVTGVWIVKFNAALEVVKNTLVRGRSIMGNGWRTAGNTFLVGGFDASRGENQNASNNSTDITLLREYDQDGDLLVDRRSNYREIAALYKYPDNSFVATTPDRILRIDASLNITSATYLTSLQLPDLTVPYIQGVSPTQDGGLFISTRLHSLTDVVDNYKKGLGFYKLGSSDAVEYYKTNVPGDTLFYAPFLLPGGDNPPRYVGTANFYNSSGSYTGNKIYELTDNGAFTFRVGDPYPDGTALKTVSQTDGFFSVGGTSTGLAAIAKLSTCAAFKLDVGSTTEDLLLSQSETVTFAGRTLGNTFYTGNKGTVTYNWTLTDITPGGAAVTGLGITSGNQTTNPNIPAQTFTLATGKTVAVLQYTVTAVDSYNYNNTPQVCQQSQTIMLKIMNYPDNVVETDCAVPVNSMTWLINTTPETLGGSNVSVYQTPYVGDLDGDGNVEIVVAKSYNAGGGGGGAAPWSYYTNGIYVFDRKDNTSTLIDNVPRFSTNGRGQIGLARPNATSEGLIVVAAMNGYLYAYKKDGTPAWSNANNRSDSVYTTLDVIDSVGTVGVGFKSASIMFSDFDGDGNTEIVTGDRIFDLETGKLLLNCGFLNLQTLLTPKVSVADVNRDGQPELIWGGNVYSIHIENRNGTLNNTCTLMYSAAVGVSHQNSVTLTAPIDIDLDGNVDILAYAVDSFYIYNPSTGDIKVKQKIPADDRGSGTPFVGDIDGDGYPEIMYGETASGLNIIAWDIDGASTAVVKWRKGTTDGSRATGLTLFDFNQDGRFEILYRDQTSMRIFDGSSQATMDTPLDSIDCVSGTLGEYPVTADVDNDGEAEIIVTGSPKGGNSTRGNVFIFKAGTGTRWAPARKVWNQYAYNVVNINEDLTVPTKLFDIATVVAGPDSIVGTTDDVQPFNGFLKQATMIDRFGNMVMYAP
ncbi:MAG: VCBS repeat-containing protein, partial [Tannerella sp.]|nr:VCBS repeat-containing protein [Tannerella sp.]